MKYTKVDFLFSINVCVKVSNDKTHFRYFFEAYISLILALFCEYFAIFCRTVNVEVFNFQFKIKKSEKND